MISLTNNLTVCLGAKMGKIGQGFLMAGQELDFIRVGIRMFLRLFIFFYLQTTFLVADTLSVAFS